MSVRALAAAALLALALPASALGHAQLLDRKPTYGAKLATSDRKSVV